MKRIGARIIKTGIAVSITMYLCNRFNLQPAVFGALAAVINLQPSLYFSLKTSFDQIKINVIGILIGMFFGYLLGNNPLTMGVVAMLIIFTYKRLNLQSGILMGIVSAIFILSAPQDLFLTNALNRTIVILIGLFVSAIVNVLLWPPRYETKIIEKIREADAAAVAYFCHAINDFTNLDKQEVHSHQEAKANLFQLMNEIHVLIDYIHDENTFKYHIAKVIDYIDGIVEKADRIYETIPTRIERRKKYANPPVTEEFRKILDLLAGGCATIERVNNDIRTKVCDDINIDRQIIHEHYWTRLTEAIEGWQHNLSSSYYVHGLIDVAVVASEIRWVSREGKKIINNLSKN